MRKYLMAVMAGLMVFGAASAASAQQWGNVLKAAGQAALQQLCPQAQTVVDQAKAMPAGATQENFIVTKAKEYLAAGNYQAALDLANYVVTTLKSGNVDAKKIMADAQAALTKIAQDKLAQAHPAAAATVQQGQAEAAAARQVQADAVQTGNSLKNLFGVK